MSLAKQFLAAINPNDIEPAQVYVPRGPAGDPTKIDAYRAKLRQARKKLLGKPGIYLDRSPAGAGKTFADLELLRTAERGVIALPTHENCAEVEFDLEDMGVDAKKFPARLTEGTTVPCPRCKGKKGKHSCRRCYGEGWQELYPNCDNPEADMAEEMGLPVVQTICRTCRSKTTCEQTGYLAEVQRAKDAQVSIATHARLAFGGFRNVADGRKLICIHEEAIGMLRPMEEFVLSDIPRVEEVLLYLLQNPTKPDPNGEIFGQLPLSTDEYDFLCHLASTLEWINSEVESAVQTKRIDPPATASRPPGIEAIIFAACRETRVEFSARPWRVVIDAATGNLHSLGVIVEESSRDGAGKSRQGKTTKETDSCGTSE